VQLSRWKPIAREQAAHPGAFRREFDGRLPLAAIS